MLSLLAIGGWRTLAASESSWFVPLNQKGEPCTARSFFCERHSRITLSSG